MKNELLGVLLYYGAPIVPALYWIGTGFRGQHTRRFGKLVGLHVAAYGLVWGLVYRNRSAPESFWLWALCIPVNIFFLIVYLCALVTKGDGALKK